MILEIILIISVSIYRENKDFIDCINVKNLKTVILASRVHDAG